MTSYVTLYRMSDTMHWCRWGHPKHSVPLSPTARGLVEAAFGPVEDSPAVALADVRLPEPTLPGAVLEAFRGALGDPHVRTDAESRVLHTRGKSTPDLLRIRSGDATDAPDAVLRPADHDEVVAVTALCHEHRVALVPFGGGTSVVGGLAARRDGFTGVVAVDLGRLDRLVSVDAESGTAVLEAGLLGPQAEALLAEHELTLGHFPQSFEYATIGGFAATRSSGQSSAGYGRFDAMVVGMRVATPLGTVELGSAPATSAGPDLRELVLGSEGAFGVITSCRVRVRRRPAVRVHDGWRFGSFAAGADAMRHLVQSGARVTVLRLSDEAETSVNLADPDGVGGGKVEGCLLIVGHEGQQTDIDTSRALVAARFAGLGGEPLGEGPGHAWADGRFHAPYLRDSLLDSGVLVETLETATFWSNVHHVYAQVKGALEHALIEQGTPPIVLCHISHLYEAGASLYFTVAAKRLDDPLTQWAAAKAAASDAIVAAGATITHHHAVGRDHKPWFAQEIGPVGVEILRAVKHRIDPHGVLNPGVLIP